MYYTLTKVDTTGRYLKELVKDATKYRRYEDARRAASARNAAIKRNVAKSDIYWEVTTHH
jgi:hypothetical protein